MRIRNEPESNYKGIFLNNGITLRYKLDETQDFKPLKHPELLDISFGTLCKANCPYCYTSAIRNGENYPNLVEKIKSVFEPLEEKRPFQIAAGGGGEPTIHPEFSAAMQAFHRLGIMPNYTTNGMHLDDAVLDATAQYCGGVAVSTHRHLQWGKAVEKLLEKKIRTNLHIIVGEENSAAFVEACYRIFPEIETIVILPYQAQGRGTPIEEQILVDEWTKCANLVNSIEGNKFAYGALMYPFILKNPTLFQKVNIYEPEMFSGYLMLDDNPTIRVSSYNLKERNI